MSLSKENIEIVKATAKPVAENAAAITTRMYAILFENHPEKEALFKDASPDQYKKLAAAVGAYAANIERLDVLGGAATDEVLAAWKEAYFFLGDLLIAREKELYAAA